MPSGFRASVTGLSILIATEEGRLKAGLSPCLSNIYLCLTLEAAGMASSRSASSRSLPHPPAVTGGHLRRRIGTFKPMVFGGASDLR